MKFILLIFLTLNLFANDFIQMKQAFNKGNISRAIAYARNNATNGDTNAMYSLALLYYSKGDIKRAQIWFKNSVADGGQGQLGIALILFSKSKTQADYKNVLKALKGVEPNKISKILSDVVNDLIEKTDSTSAQNYLKLAELFSSDKLVHPNNDLAFFLIEKAAEKKNPKAFEMIADAYNTLEKSPITAPRIQNTLLIAIKNYQKAYKLGNFDAMAKLGRLHLIGPRHVRRIEKGEKLIETSAKNGSTLGKEILKKGYRQNTLTKNENSKKSYHILFKEF